jgi:hypothetical protein
MKQTVDRYTFSNEFSRMGRSENFTYEAREALFDYLEDYEEQTGEELELDVIALCCEYQQDTWQDIAVNYSIDIDTGMEDVINYLRDNTEVVDSFEDGTILYATF